MTPASPLIFIAGAPIPVAQHMTPTFSGHSSTYNSIEPPSSASDNFTSYNPYVSSNMYTSSFMSQEGSQNIQSILAGNSAPPQAQPYAERPPPHHALIETSQYPPPSASAQYPYLPPPSQSPYTPPPSIPPPHSYPPAPSAPPQNYDPYPLPPAPSYPSTTYAAPLPAPSSSPPRHSYPPPSLSLPSQSYSSYNYPPSHLAPSHAPPTHVPPPQIPPPHQSGGSYRPSMSFSSNAPNPHQGYGGVSRHYPKPSSKPGSSGSSRKDIPALTEIKITGRPEWNLP